MSNCKDCKCSKKENNDAKLTLKDDGTVELDLPNNLKPEDNLPMNVAVISLLGILIKSDEEFADFLDKKFEEYFNNN